MSIEIKSDLPQPDGITDSQTGQLKSDPPEEVQIGDTVLLLDFQAKSLLKPPDWVWRMERQGQLRVERAPLVVNGEQLELLRRAPTTPEVQAAWTQVVAELTNAVLRGRNRGRVHVFLQGPHGVAAAMGRLVTDYDHFMQLFLYTPLNREERWTLSILPRDLTPAGPPPFFTSPERLVEDRTGRGKGHGLLALFRHAFPEERRTAAEALLERGQLKSVHAAIPVQSGWVETPAQARAAIEDLFRFAEDLRDRQGARSLHLATDGPVALVLELARKFRPTVYSEVIVYQYDGKAYYPCLDIGATPPLPCSGLSDKRAHLEILQGDEVLMYRLNGTLLEAGKPVPKPKAGLERETPKEEMEKAARALTDKLLPPQVKDKLAHTEGMDIELSLEGPAATLPWEYLRTSATPGAMPVAADPRFTLRRRVEGEFRIACPLPKAGERLRVLIAPVLAKAVEAAFAPYHRLNELEARLRERGVDVLRLDYGANLETVEAALKEHRPHILEWIGHGAERSAEGTPVLEAAIDGDTLLLDTVLLRLGLNAPMPRVVLMDSCALGSSEEAGVPQALLGRGVGAVVAFRHTVFAAELRIFAQHFYDALLEGGELHQAVQTGRRALYMAEPKLKKTGSHANPILVYALPEALRPLISRLEAELAGPVTTGEAGGPAHPAPVGGVGPDHPAPVGGKGPDRPAVEGGAGPDLPAPVGGKGPDRPQPEGGTGMKEADEAGPAHPPVPRGPAKPEVGEGVGPDLPVPVGGKGPDRPAVEGGAGPDLPAPVGGKGPDRPQPEGGTGMKEADEAGPAHPPVPRGPAKGKRGRNG